MPTPIPTENDEPEGEPCAWCDGNGYTTGFRDGGRTEVRNECDECEGTGIDPDSEEE